MEEYQQTFARLLAESGALFFADGLRLKDGRPTPYFVDLGRFRTGRLNYLLGTFFAEAMVRAGLLDTLDVVLGPSYKGSAIACATAHALWQEHGREILFEYDRKEYKTHGERSGGKSLFVNGCFTRACDIVIVDDVGTSMATKYELMEKVRAEAYQNGVELTIRAVVLGVDREQTTAVYDSEDRILLGERGEDAVARFSRDTGIAVYRVCGIREVVEYLYGERIPVLVDGRWTALDADRREAFERYLETYGSLPCRESDGG